MIDVSGIDCFVGGVGEISDFMTGSGSSGDGAPKVPDAVPKAPQWISAETRPDTRQSSRGWLGRSSNAKTARNSKM